MTIYNICNKYLHINILYIYIYTYSSPFLLATPQSQCLMVIGRDGGLSNLCHSCGLWAYVSEEGVQKTFPGPGYLSSEDGQSDYGIWHLFVNLYIYIYIYIYIFYIFKPMHSLEFIRISNFKFHALATIRGKKMLSFTRIFLCSSLKTFILIDSRTSGNTNISFNHYY